MLRYRLCVLARPKTDQHAQCVGRSSGCQSPNVLGPVGYSLSGGGVTARVDKQVFLETAVALH